MKYIVFDLDDTLLNKQSAVSEFTLQTLKRLQMLGHKLVFNTARSQYYSKKYLDTIEPDYAILNGGALIIDKAGQAIYSKMIDVPALQSIISRLMEVTEVISVQSESGFYTSTASYTAQNAQFFDFRRDLFQEPAYKIVASLTDTEAKAIACEHKLEVVSYLSGDFKRFNCLGTNKASGNCNLVRILGASLEDVIAFGDDWGDLDMLRQAGVGVLMKNAKEELHSLCPTLSAYTNDEDGVARFLLEYFHMNENKQV